MLWNVVYQFYVKYIFGGYFDGLSYQSKIGYVYGPNGSPLDLGLEAFSGYSFHLVTDSTTPYTMSLGNYFSLIATIISMVVIVLICCALIKKIYNMCAHIIG